MKKLIITATLLISASLSANESKVKKEVAKHIEANLLLHKHDDFGTKFKKLYPSTKVYKVRMKQNGGWSGLGMEAVVHNGKTKIVSDNVELRNHIVSLYKKPLKNEREIECFFDAIGNVDEVKIQSNSSYHIYTGKKFFGKKSGYLLALNKNKTIKTCEYKLKLSK